MTEILPGGAAWKQLLPGDWIRSVNGTAVNSAEEVSSFAPSYHSL